MHDDTPTTPEFPPTPSLPPPSPAATDDAAVAAQVAFAADRVSVGEPAEMLATVHRTVTRRRRRRNAVVGLAAAGTLVVSGVVVANLAGGDGGDDRIVSAPATDVATTEVDDTDDTAPAPVETEAPGEVVEVPSGEVVPVRPVAATATDVVDAGLTVPADASANVRLFPWKGGFLSVRTTYAPQPLPTELPPEIAEQFPPEVVDLFPDGLPPTINEAIAVLEEAGLLDEVTAIVTENQDVSDAIYAEQGATETTVRFSADGVEWSEIDAAFPVADNSWYEATSTGERFAIATVVDASGVPASGLDPSPAGPNRVEVYSSTDLLTWTTHTIGFPERPADLDPAFRFDTYIGSLAATDQAFSVTVSTFMDLDVTSLLDEDLRQRVQTENHGMSTGSDGVTIEFYGDRPPVTDSVPTAEIVTITWAELGLEGQPEPARDDTSAWVSTWDGTPVQVDDPDSGWTVAAGDAFYQLGMPAQRSSDGIEWTPFETPGDGYLDALVSVPDGVAIRVSDGTGASTTYVGDPATGIWQPVDVPELPAGLQGDAWGPGAFLLADYGDQSFGGPFVDSAGSRSTAEANGYRYDLEVTQTADDYSVTYTLTDVATGEVVVTETADGLSPADDPFEYVVEDPNGADMIFLDPASGEELVRIPFESMTHEVLDADGEVIDLDQPDQTTVNEAPAEESFTGPEYWVLARLDSGWVATQISDGTDMDRWVGGVVAADDVALVSWSDGTFTRIVAA